MCQVPAPPPVKTEEPVDYTDADASASEGKLVVQLSSGGEIKTINADGSGLRSLTHGIDPALSPDGQTVAFTRWAQGETGNGSVWRKPCSMRRRCLFSMSLRWV